MVSIILTIFRTQSERCQESVHDFTMLTSRECGMPFSRPKNSKKKTEIVSRPTYEIERHQPSAVPLRPHYAKIAVLSSNLVPLSIRHPAPTSCTVSYPIDSNALARRPRFNNAGWMDTLVVGEARSRSNTIQLAMQALSARR